MDKQSELLKKQSEELSAQRQRSEAQDKRLAEQARKLNQQNEAVWRFLRRTEGNLGRAFPAVSTTVGRGLSPSRPEERYVQNEPAPVPPVTEKPKPPVPPVSNEGAAGAGERPESEKPKEQLLVERGGILLNQGTLQLEPTFEYTHISNSRVAISGYTIFDAIVIGNIRVDALKRDILTGSLVARYGLTNRIQLETRIPGVFRRDSEILGVGTSDQRDRTTSTTGLGDIQASVAWQALTQKGSIPATVLRLRGTFPTGTNPFEISRETVGTGGETRLSHPPTGNGFYAIGLGPTFVWRADPAVLFAGGNYTRSLDRSFPGYGTISPGDTIEWFTGLNMAFSENLSFNLSFDNQITMSTKQNGVTSVGTSSNDARVVLGASVGVSPNTSLLVSAAVGLTQQSPDFLFTVSLPLTYNLF